MQSFGDIKNSSLLVNTKGKENRPENKPEEFLVSLELAYPENIALLAEKNIDLKPSQWIVLAKEPATLKKTILRAEEFGFIDAYMQNPSYLKADVDKVIKRMAELEHLGIPYINDKGKFQSLLFSERAYNYVVGSNMNINVELQELADRLIETFALEDKKDSINREVVEADKEGLSTKEVLIEVFTKYSINKEAISYSIDEILASKEGTRGMAAWIF